MSEEHEKIEPRNLADINPEIKKLPPEFRDEFNKRYEKKPEARYLALRASDCEKIIEEERVEQSRILREKEARLARILEDARRGEKREERLRIINAERIAEEKRLARIKKQGGLEAMKQALVWKRLYKDEFDLDLSFEKLEIPPKKSGYDRLIIVASGMALEIIFNKLSEKFDTDKYIFDLDTITSRRTADKTYAIWVRNLQEAWELYDANYNRDEDFMTLEERLLFELIYFSETGLHLDYEAVTLCNGSRDLGGCVPSVRWDDENGRLEVYWYGFAYRRDARRVISLAY